MDTDSEIAFGMENEAVPQEQMGQRVVETAKALRIENLLGRNIFALSGGEKQKIAFASVYAMNPQIYLLDEPSSIWTWQRFMICGRICVLSSHREKRLLLRNIGSTI